jgi:hypothetical protein
MLFFVVYLWDESLANKTLDPALEAARDDKKSLENK